MDKDLFLCQTGSLLRSRREELRLTLADVSQRSGVTIAQLSRIENGRADPRLSTVDRILEATGATLADIVVASPRAISLTAALHRRDLGKARIEHAGMGASDGRARLERKARLGENISAERARLSAP